MQANKAKEISDFEAVTDVDEAFMELIRRLLVEYRAPCPWLKPPDILAKARERKSVSLAEPTTVKIVKDGRPKPPIQRGINA
jgi:hypothetical protein